MICCSARQQTIDGSEHENSCMLLTTKRHGEDGQEQTKRSASRRRRRHYGRRSGDESRTLATAVLPTGRIPRGLVMFDDDGMQRHDELYIYKHARANFPRLLWFQILFFIVSFYIYFFVSIHACFQIRSCRYVCVFYSSVRFFCSPI